MPEVQKTSKKREYTWFVKPGDSHTNEAISRLLPEENFSFYTLEGETAEIGLWLCTNFQFLNYLWKSKNEAHLDFKVFKQEGNGKIEDVTFIFNKKRKKIIRLS